MFAYNKTYDDFCMDINRGRIVSEIMNSMNRSFSASEKRAFRNSLGAVKNALTNTSIPGDAEVGIEFKVPLTNKRIDFMIAGEDDKNNKNVIIVELKQWEQVKHTDMEDVVLLGNEQHVHPSWQAISYGSTLTNYNEFVEENGINIITCTFLHDYYEDYENEIKNDVYHEGLKKAPAFISNEWEKFAQFVGKKIKKKSDVNLLYEIREGKIKPSEFLVKALSDCITGNSDIELIDEQRIAMSNIKKEIYAALKHNHFTRKVIIVKGGAGTGKSLIALQLLGDVIQRKYTAFYVAKSSYIKESYHKVLT